MWRLRVLVAAGLVFGLLLAGAFSASAATPTTPYTVERVGSPDPQARGLWGERLATAGDINGDGLNDVWVALPFRLFPGETKRGRIYLVSGKDRSVLRAIESPEPQPRGFFGYSLSAFGDADGDGKLDLAVGSGGQDIYVGPGVGCGPPEPNGCNEDQGKAWVFSGRTGALLHTLNNPFPQGNASNGAGFGSEIGSAGDVTGDGRADVIVGALANDVPAAGGLACGDVTPFPANCRKNQGQAFIFDAATGALFRTLELPDTNSPPAPCGAPAGQLGMSSCGFFGAAVQSPGDVDGDGIGDQLVDAGSYNFDTTGTGTVCRQPPTPEPNGCNENQGRMYVFSGANGRPILRIDDPAPQTGASFGRQDAAPGTPGDVNGDGFADLYAGAFRQNGPGGDGSGRAWVFRGGPASDPNAGRVLYEVLDPSPEVGGGFGWSVARTDYNNDGRPDLYVGSLPGSGTASGGTYVFNGPDGSLLKPFELPASDLQPTMGGSNDGPSLGRGLAAPGDLNGDGEPDYLGGAPGFDASAQDEGRVYAYLSAGPDLEVRPRAPVDPQPAAPFADCPSLTANVIRGTLASEPINGTARGDRIFAGTGNDTVDGLAGNDCIDLGPGTDRGQGGDGADLIRGGTGADRMAGNVGNDRLRGGSAGDRLIGGFGDDRLHGQSGPDRVNGERGRDRINGGSSNDVISAGSSRDRVAGDQGNDRINGNSGNDVLKGNSGNDRIKGSTGRDRIFGGGGKDRLDARDGRGGDRIACGIARDSVVADRGDRIARDCERVRSRR